MVEESPRKAVLISIHPQHARSIAAGVKRVEFRKVRFKESFSFVVMYETSPVKAITGYFAVSLIDVDSPKELWKRYSSIAGVGKELFDSYYQNSTKGVAIKVKEVFHLENSIPLEAIYNSSSPPQSYSYIPEEKIERIRRLVDVTELHPSPFSSCC